MNRTFQLSLAAISLALVAGACGSKNAGTGGDGGVVVCENGVDLDGDGYGDGCAAGPDCADHDPSVHADCCSVGTFAGCPCDPAVDQPITCFDGDPALANTPPCMKGSRSCDAATSLWGHCEGQTPPSLEACDGLDNDCDGTVDDGVLTACGNCTPGCDTTGSGDGTAFPFPPQAPLPDGIIDVGADGVGLDPNGDLVLDDENVEFHFLWVANDPQGTVSKIDTVTGKEVARYASVTHDQTAIISIDGANTGLVPAWNAGQNHPSRTAVDFFGNVWVGNRAPGQQPSATKIMNAIGECTDRNGNGVVDTSSDVNGDGVITVTDPLEFKAEADECIKFTVALGQHLAGDGNRFGARALAIDSGIDPGDPGNVWVGLFHEQAFYQLDGATGQKVRYVPITGTSPYGAAIDSQGRLWAPNGCCGASGIIGINTVTGAVIMGLTAQTGTMGGSYGIAIDQMDRVWLGGYPLAAAIVFDPGTAGWTQVNVTGYQGAGWGGRGVGADADGNIWVSLHRNVNNAFIDGAVARINTTTLASTGAWDLGNGAEVPVGCAVDFDGNIWSVNQNTSNASRLYINPATNEPAPNPLTGNQIDTFPTGPNPYTYSDFTGFGLRNITRPSGDYKVVHEGCEDGSQAHWLGVDWAATVPAGTSVEIWVRSGDDPATLGQQTQYGPWLVSPADFQVPPGPVPDGKYLELTIRLISIDRTTTPVVHSYDLQWTCPGIVPG